MKGQLGQGLEALIPPKAKKMPFAFLKEGENTGRRESVFWVEVGKIKSNPHQPRQDFDEASLRELADSIREFGILQPLIVSKIERETPRGLESEYQLIAGERRLRAAKMVGFSQVPVIIRKPDEQKKLEVSLVENIQRENLNAMERARAFEKLIQDFGLNQKEVALCIGKSRELVANTLRLLELPQEIKGLVSGGKISEGHARTLIGLGKDEQRVLVERIVNENLSVRAAEELVRRARREVSKIESEFQKEIERLEAALEKLFPEIRVRIVERGSHQRLIFRFPQKTALREFLAKLQGALR